MQNIMIQPAVSRPKHLEDALADLANVVPTTTANFNGQRVAIGKSVAILRNAYTHANDSAAYWFQCYTHERRLRRRFGWLIIMELGSILALTFLFFSQ